MTKDDLLHLLTVGDLASVPGGALMVLAKDAEGDSYSPMASGEHMRYVADTTWSGAAYSLDDSDYTDDEGESADAIVLWPTN